MEVRESGETNMFDIKGVQRAANKNNYYSLVNFIDKVERKELFLALLEDDFDITNI